MRRAVPLAALLVAGALGVGCTPEAPAGAYVARVGTQVLTEEELARRLEQAVPGQDTTALRRALVADWVGDALLFEAALAAGTDRDPEIARQVEQNRQALLASAYVSAYLREHPPELGDADIADYYARNKARLPLREPYVQYHLFGGPTEKVARQARLSLARRDVAPDTLWRAWRGRPGFVVVVDSAGPERGLYATLPEVRDRLMELRPGQTSGVIEADSLFYVAHVVARGAPGDEAPLAWVQGEIVHRLRLEAQKRAARRLVETLRAQALARGLLDVRPDSLQ